MRFRRLYAAGLAALLAPSFGCRRADAPAPAVAGNITGAEELLWGPAATGAIGDFVLQNGRVMAVVTRDASTSGFAASQGNLVDLAPIPDGEDQINEIFLYLNDEFPRQARYTKVEIVNRGGGAREARVRASGVDTGDPRIRVVTDYVLRPDEHWITLETRFTSSATATIHGYELGDAIQWGRTEHMAPGYGFNLPGKRVNVDWICGIGKETSYALVPDGPQRFDTFNGSMWSDPIGRTVDLEPKKTVTYVRHLVVGLGDTASLATAVAKLRGDATGRITGRVAHSDAPVSDALVRIIDTSTDDLAGLAHVDRSGRYSIELAPGRYRAMADAPGRVSVAASPDTAEVAAGASVVMSFSMGEEAVIAWRIRGDDGRAPPLKIGVIGLGDTPTPRFGAAFRAEGAENFVLSARGAGELRISPGHYRVFASRGLEYELIEEEVVVAAGKRAEITGQMVRAFSTPGLISADLHQHAAPSFDSGVSLPDRALSNAAEGVEVLVATEHNILIDYRPVIAAGGLGRVVFSLIGVEATTHSVGHFNAFPLRVSPGKPRGGMVDPEGWTPQMIIDFVRNLGEPGLEPYIQANHPRSGRTGYFDLMGLDANTARASDPRFTADFDGVEVITFGKQEETERAMNDWFALLRAGHRLTGTGTSDSHTITLRPVGWPRTFVCVDQDDPPYLDVVAFTRALKEGCATLSAGPLVTIRTDDARMGGTARARAGRIELEVEVRAATWIGTDRLVLYVDGVPKVELPLKSEGIERYRGRHTITCERDCFVLAYVDSQKSLDPVITARPKLVPLPVALTNPIFVDVDGDGVYGRPSKERP